MPGLTLSRRKEKVAPFAGAWIEIEKRSNAVKSIIVAPFAGAWIEIDHPLDRYPYHEVAPFAGAWIEI